MSTPTIDHDRDHDLDLASRVGRLEGLVEQIALRLDGLERRIEALEQTMAAGFAELRQAIAAANEATNNRIESTNNRIESTNNRIESTNSRMDKQFRWLIGIQFGIIGLLVTILLKGG